MNIRKPFSARGMTLVELLVSLTILTMISTTVVSMLRASSQLNTAINSSMTNGMEVEQALHRIVQQLRHCGSFNVPNGLSGGTTFSLVTQPDTANASQIYTVSYALVTAADGTQQLQETDSRYGTSTLVNNVQSFDVRYKAVGTPKVIVITLTAGKYPGVTPLVKATPRNQ